jgi:PPOX class probable F420-dependent enzyme
VTSDEKRAFVRDNHRAVLITWRADGRVQSSPIVCGVHTDGRIAISVTEDRAKTKNLRRDPRATLCVLNDGFFGEWTQIDGTTEIVAMPDALDGLKDLYRQVAGEHPDWDDYAAAMARERRVLLLISIDDD